MLGGQFDLTHKLAVVAGGSGGIGRVAAKVYLELAARVIITGLGQAAIDEAVAELEPIGQVTGLEGDARDASHLEEIVRTAADLCGAEILVNAVGAQRRMPLLEATAGDLEFLWSVNVASVFDLTQRLLPQMVSRGYGKVVNMCSIASFVGLVDKTMYAITKGALLQYTRSAAVELAPMGVRVNGIAPGFVDTPMTHDYIHSEREAEFLSAIPLGRFAVTGDLEAAFAYLASAASDYMTGHVIVLDGGETISSGLTLRSKHGEPGSVS